MKDLRRIPVIAVVLIVVLRVSIGWQFLYEGLWKYDTMDTPEPWTAEGYLKNAQGPFRDHFRSMTGDPDDLGWLDFDHVSRRWYDWRDRFAKHYALDEEQVAKLNRLIDGLAAPHDDPETLPPFPQFRQKIPALPEGVDLSDRRLTGTIEYDEAKQQLVVKRPMLPSEETKLKAMVPVVELPSGLLAKKGADGNAELDDNGQPIPADQVVAEYYKAISRLADLSHRLSYRQKLAASLRGDPDWVGVAGRLNERGSYDITMGTVSRSEEDATEGTLTNVRYGEIQEYKDLVDWYNNAVKQAEIEYQFDHLNKIKTKLSMMRAKLVGPIRTLESDLKEDAFDLLTAEQLAYGALPLEDTPVNRASAQAMWGLLILGTLLIVGLGTRFAALAGAFMLLNFYLVMPPWPGVPEAPGPEHSFIVNKNLIEVICLVAVAALPTGSWFGIDAIIWRWYRGRVNELQAEGK